MEDLAKRIKFYRDLYLQEEERSKFYDKVVQYPTTLLVIITGVIFYFYNSYFDYVLVDYGFVALTSWIDWVVFILVCIFLVCAAVTALLIFLVFHGFTRKYDHLPFAKDLINYELELYKHGYKHLSSNSYSDKRNKAKEYACEESQKILLAYYVQFADVNQRINDKRAIYYFWTRTFIFIDLVLLLAVTVFGLIK